MALPLSIMPRIDRGVDEEKLSILTGSSFYRSDAGGGSPFKKKEKIEKPSTIISLVAEDQQGTNNNDNPLIVKSRNIDDFVKRQNFRVGYGGSRQFTFEDSREQLPFLLPPNHTVPVWKIVGKFIN